MIFHKPCQINTHTCMRAILAFFSNMDVARLENVLNKELAHMCEWLVDNKLSSHFGEDKTKCTIFSKEKNLAELNITYDNNRIKQFHIVEYLDCYLDANLSEESMAMDLSKFLNPKLRRLLCNSLIQPHFDYACVSWCSLVSKNIRKKIQVPQNKCICFCLKLDSRHHIGAKDLRKSTDYQQRVATNAFKYWKGTSLFYVNELFVPSTNIFKTRSYMVLEIPLRKSNLGQRSKSYMGPSVWNKLNNELKILNTAINKFE